MKDIVFTRKIDELGRVVLPVEMRRTAGMEPLSTVQISRSEDGLLVTRAAEPAAACICCHAVERLRHLPDGRWICESCLSRPE